MSSTHSELSRRELRLRRRRFVRVLPAVAALALAALLAPFVAFQPAHADDAIDAPALVQFNKSVSPAAPTPIGPGQSVNYQFTANCSSLTVDCLDLTLSDVVPAPLVVTSVSGITSAIDAVPLVIERTGNSFTAKAVQPLGAGRVGLPGGTILSVTVNAMVPTDVSADYDGATVTNTATVTISNQEDLTLDPPRPSTLQSSASVLLAVPRINASTTTKTVTPETTPALLGRSVAFALGATNTSNGSVDELVIQEPANTSSTILDYVAITGLSGLSFPSGADRVRIDWFDGTAWTTGTPAAVAALPSGVDSADLRGLRIVFSATSGSIARGATGGITIEGALTATAAAVGSPQTLTNVASSWVRHNEATSPAVNASDTLRIDPTSISPIASKQFQNSYVIGGALERVTIGGQNGGDFGLKEMTLTEPAPGSTSLADQGLSFDGWIAADIEWPAGATSVEVSYWYEGEADFSAPIVSTTADTLPAPVGPAAVEAVRVRFLSTLPGGMAPGQYASLPFRVLTDTVLSDITTVNQVRLDVVALDDQTATALASDDLTRRTARVNTTVSKTVTPGELYSIAGSTALVSLPGRVNALPTSAVDPTASTVGSVSLVISDPVDTGADQFWNHMDLTHIVATAVPANTLLTVEYWNGTEWLVLPVADELPGPTILTTSIPESLRDQIAGIRFVYQHSGYEDGALLNPGFTVQPNLRFVLRDQLRDGTGEAASSTRTEPIELQNTVQSAVENPTATPPQATASADAPLELLPTDDGTGGGPGGVESIAKEWHAWTGEDDIVFVNARSADQATARISWGTAGIPFDRVVLSDTASDPSAGGFTVANTVFEAFDLVSIPAITASMDPLLTYDRIVAVELFLPGSGPGTGWVAASGDPCPAACDGTFPGYTLTEAERAAAVGVRLIVEESPTRASRIGDNPLAPPVGTGVASVMGLDRSFDLVFEVRDDRRSDESLPVLGSSRGAIYNTGDPGVVNNTTRMQGFVDETELLTRTADDTIHIFDQPINVEVTKTWEDGPLGTPPAGTPQALYPRARMEIVATNTSVTRIDELSILDPVALTNPFEAVNLYDIVSISVPTGATSSTVILEREDASFTGYTVAQALALNPAALATVVGIEVVHTGRIGVAASSTLVLDTQLREFLRSDGTTRVNQGNSDTVLNTVGATITDPGGPDDPAPATVNTVYDEATAQVNVQDLSYGVIATKGIQADTTATTTAPATQWEGNSRNATVTLSGRPTGNVRSTDMTFTDITPSFWNAYNFNGFGSHSFAAPINRVKVDVLVGVTYVVDDDSGDISVECLGSPVLDACWVQGSFGTSLALPGLPSGATTADIRGIRFHYTRSDSASWERPYNPLQTTRFTVTRRDMLVEPSDRPVPSTLYIFTEPAPGEDAVGIFTNDVTVRAWAADDLWWAVDDDSRQTAFRHRPAEVRVEKTPYGEASLGAQIPYEITVRNLGTGDDKDLSGLTIVDLIPVDLTLAPMLVTGIDPETGHPFDPQQIITLSLVNATGQTVTPPSFTAVLGTAEASGQPLTITPNPSFVLPKQWTLTVSVPLQFRPLLEAGTAEVNFAENQAIVTSDQEFDRCEYSGYTSEGIFQISTDTFVESCTAATRVWALPSAPMNIVKGVKGVGAGPLDVNGDPILDPLGEPYDDLGVIRTVDTGADCGIPSLAVNGELYYRYPCVPITRPGGTEEWVANFFNAGNVRVHEVVAIDVLPRQNDRGVIINDARSSRWAPILTERPRLIGWPQEALTVYYTDRLNMATPQCNGADIQAELGMTPFTDPPMVPSYQSCIDFAGAGGLPDRNNPATGWQVMPANPDSALLESVIALKFVVDLEVGVDESLIGLAPGNAISIVYQSTTAREPVLRETTANLDRDSIAYNSIAGAARGKDGSIDLPYRFVTEPRKVGVALATGSIDLAKIVDGAAASFAPGSFAIEVDCTVDGEPIQLLDSAGNNRSPFTRVGNASAVRINGIPLYAECEISEPGSYGATTTVIAPAAPATVTARALDYSPSEVFNPRPLFDDRPDILLGTVTNTYEAASLTVSKTVDLNGAVDQAGNPIAITGFQFSIACTFDNGSGPASITMTPTSFTLNHGESRTYTGLPAGAVCTVTETQTRSATVTKVITTGGVPAASTSGITAQVTLAPNDLAGLPTNAVDYTNSIPVGSLTVTKAITGAGDAEYGTGTFTIRVSCTRTGATPNPVYLADLTFSAATVLSRTIDNLPAGAVCAITEQGDAGATQVTNPSNVTIVGGSTLSGTVTNRFDLASLTVGKTVQTAAVDAEGNPVYPAGDFEFSVACTFQGGTVLATGFASSPMTFALRHGDTRTLTGLPARASCTVTETETQDADSTAIALNIGGATSSVAGVTTTIASLAADGGTVGAPVVRNTAQFSNLYGVSSFTITKDVLGGGGPQFAPATFTASLYCVTPDDVVAYDGEVTVPANGFVTIDNLADGSTCTVVELDVDDTGATAHRIVDDEGDEITGEDIEITAANPGRVTLENWYLTGEIEITKTIIGEGAEYGIGPFELTLSCELDGVAVIIDGGATRTIDPSVPSTMTAVYSLLPAGAECTLTESGTAGATSTRILDADGEELSDDATTGWSFTVQVDATLLEDDQPQPALGVENTFLLGALDVSKTVEGDAVDQDGTAIEFGPFPVSISCVFEGTTVYGAGYSALTPMQRSLEDGEDWSITALPIGAACTVTETNTMDAASTVIVTAVDGGTPSTVIGASATVAVGDATTADITNGYTVGSIELSKSLTGAGVEAWGDQEFEIEVTCELDDATGERTVYSGSFVFQDGDDPVLIENLATGALCTITETRTGAASSTTITVDGDDTAGTTAVVPVADELIEIEVTNVFALGEVEVTKLRDGDGAALWGDGPFEVELSCVRDIDGVEEQIEIPDGAVRELNSANLYTATYTGLPLHAVCTVEETLTAGATSTSIDVDDVTVAATPVGFTITNTFEVGSVRVDKSFAGDGTGLYAAGPYEVELSCVLEIDGVDTELEIPGGPTRELTGLNGYTASWTTIPAGAECSVTETRTGGATSTAIEDDEFVVVADEQHLVSLENTFLLASFSITKDVSGPFAWRGIDSTFVIEASCLWDVDGVLNEVIPDDDRRHDIRHGEVVEFLDLPAAAECSIVEIDDGGASAQLIWLAGVLQLGDLALVDGLNEALLANLFLPTLADTGIELVLWLQAIAALILLGMLLVTIARRRTAG